MPIYDEAWAREDKITTPGGSALNSARAQMYSNPGGRVYYFGCIGTDEKGQSLKASVAAAGIESRLEETDEAMTSVCVSVVVGKERTLIAHIAAAKKFSMDYLRAHMVSFASVLTYSLHYSG